MIAFIFYVINFGKFDFRMSLWTTTKSVKRLQCKKWSQKFRIADKTNSSLKIINNISFDVFITCTSRIALAFIRLNSCRSYQSNERSPDDRTLLTISLSLTLHLSLGIATRRGMPRAHRELSGPAVWRRRRGARTRAALASAVLACHRVAVLSGGLPR